MSCERPPGFIVGLVVVAALIARRLGGQISVRG